VASLGELNDHLLAGCRRDLELPGADPHRDRTREQLLDEERRCLRDLPDPPFEACRWISTRIDKHALVTVDTHHYSAPVRWAHHPVVIKAFVDRVELWCEHERVAAHPRPRMDAKGQFVLEPTHYLNLLKIKPGSLDNARAFKGQPWGEDFDLLRRELEYRYGGEGTRKFINVLLLLTEHEEDAVRQAVSRCVRRRAFSDEAVAAVLRHEPVTPARRLDLSHRPQLVIVSDGIRPAALYDRLCAAEQGVLA